MDTKGNANTYKCRCNVLLLFIHICAKEFQHLSACYITEVPD